MKLAKLITFTALLVSNFAFAQDFFLSADPRPPRFCMQNFNTYGPVYASAVALRTKWITGYLTWIPKCHVVQFQEVWNSGQIYQIEKALSQAVLDQLSQ